MPSQIGGATLDLQTFSGTQIAAPTSAQWTQLLASLGATAADLSLTVSVPAQDAKSDFQIGAFRIARTDWKARLAAFVNAANADGKYTFSQVQLAGKTVQRGQNAAPPAAAKGYYYLAGDTLVFMRASDEAEVMEALSKLPASGARADEGPAPASAARLDGPPPTGFLLITPLRKPFKPFCVSEFGNPDNQFAFLLTDGNGIPPISAVTLVRASFGLLAPPGNTGPLVSFLYLPTLWGGSDAERITLDAFATGSPDKGSLELHAPDLDVELCLSGKLWSDGVRVLQVDQKGAVFTAAQTSGTQTCGAPLKFSGTFSPGAVATLFGSDLTICNPPECVSAGFQPKTTLASYTGVIFADAKSMDITWQDPTYALVHNQDGLLTSCDQTGTAEGKFTLTRPHSDPWPP